MSPHFRYRFLPLAPLRNRTGPSCSNGLPGVQKNSICCEARCGTCGGAGCKGRPGGEVRLCQLSFGLALCYHTAQATHTVYCSLSLTSQMGGGPQAPTNSLANLWLRDADW